MPPLSGTPHNNLHTEGDVVSLSLSLSLSPPSVCTHQPASISAQPCNVINGMSTSASPLGIGYIFSWNIMNTEAAPHCGAPALQSPSFVLW